MREHVSLFFSSCIVFLLLPIVLSFMITGTQICVLDKEKNVEEYLPAIVYMQIPMDYETETIKAQTVIARTNLYLKLKQGKTLSEIIREELGRKRNNRFSLEAAQMYQKFCTAARETKGQVLLYEQEIRQVPYHALSAGRTRDGEEVFRDEAYSYLVSVDSREDIKADDFLQTISLNEKEYQSEIEVLQNDQSDYILEMKIGEKLYSGEEFRQMLYLPSSCFSIEKTDKGVRIICKGKGHGVGFSQYGGNALAKKDMTYDQILQYYFPKMNLETRNTY